MTKLGFLNYYILQWFFIRLTRCEDKVRIVWPGNVKWQDVTATPSQSDPRTINVSIGGMITEWDGPTYSIVKWKAIMFWVIPGTGWGSDFKYLGKCRYLDITKKVETIVGPPPPEHFNCRCTAMSETARILIDDNPIPDIKFPYATKDDKGPAGGLAGE